MHIYFYCTGELYTFIHKGSMVGGEKELMMMRKNKILDFFILFFENSIIEVYSVLRLNHPFVLQQFYK